MKLENWGDPHWRRVVKRGESVHGLITGKSADDVDNQGTGNGHIILF